jgi:hypothetical protein
VAALLVLERSYPQYQPKRRHPFESQRTTRGGAVQIRALSSKVTEQSLGAQEERDHEILTIAEHQ